MQQENQPEQLYLENGDDMHARGAQIADELKSERGGEVPAALLRPIPVELEAPAGWKELPIRESGEPLVPLGSFSDHNSIFTSSVYYGEHSNSPYHGDKALDETLITMFARESVISRLERAQEMLPQHHYLIVLDSYRSLEVQKALYDHYYQALAKLQPGWTTDQLSAETQKYVSLPSTDETRPSPHNTGGSVDVAIFTLPPEVDTRCRALDHQIAALDDELDKYPLQMEKISLIRRNAHFLNFGTEFDHGGVAAQLNYFELLERERALTDDEREARDNRRLLYNVMIEAGMQSYLDEWWHFNAPESQMGAKSAGLDHAEFGASVLSEENQRHEVMRRGHHGNLVRVQEEIMSGVEAYSFLRAGKIDSAELLTESQRQRLTELQDLNVRVLNETGDPRLTGLPKAAIIEPPDVSEAA